MFFLLFNLQRLVSENLHFERKNPTFRRSVDGAVKRTAGVRRISQSNEIEASSQSHEKSQIVTIRKRLASIERNERDDNHKVSP